MAHKITIHDAVFTPRTVELPEVCPACQAPLHDPENAPLREWAWNDVQHIVNFADTAEDAPLQYHCDGDPGEDFFSAAYYCECGHCFAEGTTVVERG